MDLRMCSLLSGVFVMAPKTLDTGRAIQERQLRESKNGVKESIFLMTNLFQKRSQASALANSFRKKMWVTARVC